MDPSFFGLDGHPFDNSSDRDETYITETHASLITELKAGLKAPHGITLLIGEEGTGKTTLVRKFADESAENCTVAYLPTTGPGLRHLLTETIEQLGGSPPPAGDEQALLDCLASLARARAEHGRTTLVVVDDAHELPAKTIERVGRLFGDDPAEPSMLHVILVGRPELLDRMNAANDRTILKHLVQVCRMDPIGPEESFRYIADRVAKVGGIVDKLFTEDALRMIVKRANGNPGRIDAICSAALEQAAESGEAAVAADTVDMACVGVEGFTMETNGTAAEKDPMQYIFGEDEVEDRETRVARRLHGSVNGTNGTKEEKETLPLIAAPMAAAPTTPRGAGTAAMLADAATAVRERLGEATGNVTDSRKRLGVWALGLVVVLAAFAATMTRTGERGPIAASTKQTKLASADGKAAKAKTSDTKVSEQAALPATAVRTSKLIVKRDGETLVGDEAAAIETPTASEAAAPPAAPADAAQGSPGSQAAAGAPAASAPSAVAPSPVAPSAAPPASTAKAPIATVTGSAPSAVAAPAQAQVPPARATANTAATPPAAQPAQAAPVKGEGKGAGAQLAPTQLAAAAKPAPIAAPPASASPAATAPIPGGATAKPAAPAATTTATEATKVASAKAPAATQAAGGAKYTVQVGAFKSRENAESLAEKLRKSYPDARVIAAQGGGATVYRVVSGAFASKPDADGRAKTLTGAGYTAFARDYVQ